MLFEDTIENNTDDEIISFIKTLRADALFYQNERDRYARRVQELEERGRKAREALEGK